MLNSHLLIGSTLFLTLTSALATTWSAAPNTLAAPLAVVVQDPDDEDAPPAMSIAYHRTNGVSAYELEEVASDLFMETWLMVSAIPGLEDPNYFPVLQAVGSASIVVAGPEKAMPGVLELLGRLEEELRASQDPASAPLVTRQFQLRHVGRQAVETALQPFRLVYNFPPNMAGESGTFETPTITILDDTGLVIVRDSEARLSQMASILESIDRPAPQVRLTYLLLRGYDTDTLANDGLSAADLDHDLPKDLIDDLGSLAPVVGFRRMSFGVVQGNALAPKSFSDRFAYSSGSIDLDMRPVSFDEKSGTLTVDRIEFQCTFEGDGTSQSFSTGARLAPDEYMVLGGVGNLPVFLVLRMTRL